ncbi:hypothetical protein AVEN_237542-1 [Araneus ventricosus]|uniref:Uncharacterized protein n=1 Tax=Araneus ventricosus TaxID=182803 RepID=A0A4Y2MWG2_ARAVE|nr:hypothetical protein AVEN_237542-1 [Araneus ventricosus]
MLPSYLKRFGLHSTHYCGCGEIGNPLHYAARCPLTFLYHHKEPSPQFTVHWGKSALSNKLAGKHTVIDFNLEIDASEDSPPGTRNSMNTHSSSRAH